MIAEVIPLPVCALWLDYWDMGLPSIWCNISHRWSVSYWPLCRGTADLIISSTTHYVFNYDLDYLDNKMSEKSQNVLHRSKKWGDVFQLFFFSNCNSLILILFNLWHNPCIWRLDLLNVWHFAWFKPLNLSELLPVNFLLLCLSVNWLIVSV